MKLKTTTHRLEKERWRTKRSYLGLSGGEVTILDFASGLSRSPVGQLRVENFGQLWSAEAKA